MLHCSWSFVVFDARRFFTECGGSFYSLCNPTPCSLIQEQNISQQWPQALKHLTNLRRNSDAFPILLETTPLAPGLFLQVVAVCKSQVFELISFPVHASLDLGESRICSSKLFYFLTSCRFCGVLAVITPQG